MASGSDPELTPTLQLGLEHAQAIGAIGRAPLAQHVEHSRGFADVIATITPTPTSIIDLGTGGGIPGLVLAEHFPEAIVTLLDGRAGRIRMLEELADQLAWGYRLQLAGDRAERFGQIRGSRQAYQFVVARGFARPSVTAECAAPLLAPGGYLIVSEPPVESDRQQRWDREALALLGLDQEFVEHRGFHYSRMQKVGICPDEYPRRIGIPEKRPLF